MKERNRTNINRIVSWSNYGYSEPSDEVYREIHNLSQLEDRRSTPKLLGYAVRKQGSSDELPGGYIAHIVMQKVPGENLHGFDPFTKEEQNQNIIWEPESGQGYVAFVNYPRFLLTCCSFIVDLEDVEQHTNRTKDDVCLDALEQLEYWGLIERQYDSTLFFQKDKLLEDLKTRLYSQ
ncbi:hypothetical protein ARAM_006044 [Aspergillus rambellii]|uniref:Uncharacterized protein n=1 Tax=Aspergillus rambellii TaxID=308745 RepID=A0A0F8XMK6_9EURO|nr:hypothetical protein ARAM_006044 [Aspergillus rambellii]